MVDFHFGVAVYVLFLPDIDIGCSIQSSRTLFPDICRSCPLML